MMNDIERIRKKIYPKNRNTSFLWMYRMMIVFMCAITFILSGLIVTETSFEDAKQSLLQYMNKLELGNIVVFENWFLPSNKAVNSTISYQKIDDHYFTNISDSIIPIVIVFLTFVSILIGSIISMRKVSKNGLINGAIIGGTYVLLLYLISSILNTGFTFNIYTVIMIIAGIISGIIGGIIGINS